MSIHLEDFDGENSDRLTIKVSGLWNRPKYEDELMLWLGYEGNGLFYMGRFKVLSTEREDDNVLTIDATGISFSKTLKVKKDRSFEKTCVKDIAKIIAGEHDLDLKCDVEMCVDYYPQHNESDMSFMNSMAKNFNLVFGIKNNTLILMRKRDEKNNSNESLPVFDIHTKDVMRGMRIKHASRTIYSGAEVVYRDTKENNDQRVFVGNEDGSILRIEGVFESSDDAMNVAKAKLARSNSGTVAGSLKLKGSAIYAGAMFRLLGSVDDDREYSIKKVKHSFDQKGWVTSIDFEN
jgi:phage protein D